MNQELFNRIKGTFNDDQLSLVLVGLYGPLVRRTIGLEDALLLCLNELAHEQDGLQASNMLVSAAMALGFTYDRHQHAWSKAPSSTVAEGTQSVWEGGQDPVDTAEGPKQE